MTYQSMHSTFGQPRLPEGLAAAIAHRLAGPQHVDATAEVDGVVDLVRVHDLAEDKEKLGKTGHNLKFVPSLSLG